MEVLLKGRFKAGLADLSVHVVFFTGAVLVCLFYRRPLAVGHSAHGAQNVGGVVGIVFPDGGGLDHQAGDIQLQQCGQIRVGHVFNEGVGGQIRHAPQVEFIPQPNDGAGFRVCPFAGNFIAPPQPLHQQRGGDIRVDPRVQQVILKIALPGGGIVVQRVFIGPILCHREMVDILDAQFPALVNQLIQVGVGAGGGLDDIVVDDQIIAGPVAHQHIAVAVQNVAPSRLDTGLGDKFDGVVLAGGLNYLQLEQPDAEKGQNQHKKQNDGNRAVAAYSFHESPPILPMALTSQCMGSIKARLNRAVRKNTPALSQMVSPMTTPIRKTAIS